MFKNLIEYIEGDPRFTGLRRKHRDLVEVWVRKEYRNMKRLYRWGLNVPKVLGVHKNVLVMEYLGSDTSPSPKLREVEVDDPQAVYDDLLHFLAVAWQHAEMVHGDFSPYNILWHDGRACVIDVGQAVVESHPKAQEFLVRDVTRLVEWGEKQGLDVTLAETCMRSSTWTFPMLNNGMTLMTSDHSSSHTMASSSASSIISETASSSSGSTWAAFIRRSRRCEISASPGTKPSKPARSGRASSFSS